MAISFSSLNIQRGELLTFVPTCRQVVVIDDSHIANTDGTKPTTLSGYCVMNMPEEQRNKSNSYQGPAFFTYNGIKLTELAKQATPTPTPTPTPTTSNTETTPATLTETPSAIPTPTPTQTVPETAQKTTETEPTQTQGQTGVTELAAEFAKKVAELVAAQQQPQQQQQTPTIDEAAVVDIINKELSKRGAGVFSQHNVEIINPDGDSVKIENAPENFNNIVNMVANRVNVYLHGPAGCGKSYMAKLVAKALKLDYYEISTVTQEYKATGYMDANGKFNPTELTKAVQNGGLLFFDELDCSCQDALTVLNGLLAECDKGGGLFHCVDGNSYPINNNFRVIAAGNTVMAGATSQYVASLQQSAAGVDRWLFVPVDYSKNIELAMAEGDGELVELFHELRNNAEKQGVDLVCSYRGLQTIKKLEKCTDFSRAELLKMTVFKQLEKDTINRLVTACNNGGEWLEAALLCL